MIEQMLNRTFVIDQLDTIIGYLDRSSTGQAEQVALEAARSTRELEQQTSSGQIGFDESDRRGAETPEIDDVSFFSRDPIVNNLQSALEEYFESEQPELIQTAEAGSSDRRDDDEFIPVTDRTLVGSPATGGDGRRLFDKFSITDIGWVCSAFAAGVTKFRGKHDFRDQPASPFPLANRARLLVVGDWGSGLPRARGVANVMRTVLDEGIASSVQQHVVHLGDVYYSGWQREYKKRFLPYWPVKPAEARAIGSWSVNSNHDMYSGGHAYFDTLLAEERFARQERSSYFSLANSHWRILGLDTAWDDGGLHGGQVRWLTEEAESAKRQGQRVMLLTHHPLFSAYDRSSAKLAAQVEGVLSDGGIDVWLWGHEHRLMSFVSNMNLPTGRCIGHGGVPVYMWRDQSDAVQPPGEFEYRAHIRHGLEEWAVLGFAALDLDGPTIRVRYINEFGAEHRTETWP